MSDKKEKEEKKEFRFIRESVIIEHALDNERFIVNLFENRTTREFYNTLASLLNIGVDNIQLSYNGVALGIDDELCLKDGMVLQYFYRSPPVAII